MYKTLCAVAILAAASTAVVAKDLKQDQKAPAPTVKATVMNDAEMDKVTAGGMVIDTSGTGLVSTNSSDTGAFHAAFNGFQGNNPHAARCSTCGF